MKKYIVLLFFISMYLPLFCQMRIITSSTCNDVALLAIPGKWAKEKDLIYNETIHLTKTQQQEVLDRIDALHKLFQEAYPEAMGADAVWHRFLSYSLFGPGFKYYKNNSDVLTEHFIGGIPVCNFSYNCALFPYYCSHSPAKNEAIASYPGETGTVFRIFANDIEALHDRKYDDDTMTVNGFPVYKRHPAKEFWKGCELLYDERDGNIRTVLIHRPGILPYIPVTRKQYLDYAIIYLIKFFDDLINSVVKIPGDQITEEYRNEMKTIYTNNKIKVLKHYNEALEKTMTDNMLDSAAIIIEMCSIHEDVPVFTAEATGGKMLIIENPAYMRNDLPKYVPQLFVIDWEWMQDEPSRNFKKILEEKFPVDKLQEMIDK